MIIALCLFLEFCKPEPKLKKRKREENTSIVLVTSDSNYNGNGLALAVKLWDLLHSSDYLQREIGKLSQQLRLDTWLNPFLTDLAMYKGLHHEVLARLSQEGGNLSVNLRLASMCFFLRDYKVRYYYNHIIIFLVSYISFLFLKLLKIILFSFLGNVGTYCSGSKFVTHCIGQNISQFDSSKHKTSTLFDPRPFPYFTILLQIASFSYKGNNFFSINVSLILTRERVREKGEKDGRKGETERI